jgi:hypothetical protein
MLCPERSHAPSRRIRTTALLFVGGLCLTQIGCASEFAGIWKGECDVGVGSSGTTVPVKLELGDDGRDLLTGTGEFEYNEYVFEGAANGRIVEDENLKVDIEGVSGGYVIQLEIEAEMGPDELEGICAFNDQDTLYEGDIALKNTESE